MFIDVDEVKGNIVPSTIALAQFPGYNMTVNNALTIGSIPAISIASGSVNATIQNASLSANIINSVVPVKAVVQTVGWISNPTAYLVFAPLVLPALGMNLTKLVLDVANTGTSAGLLMLYVNDHTIQIGDLNIQPVAGSNNIHVEYDFGGAGIPNPGVWGLTNSSTIQFYGYYLLV